MANKNKQLKHTPPRQPLSKGKLWAFRLIALSLPLAILGIAELTLRYYGYGGNPQMLQKVGTIEGGELVVAEQGGAVSWFFANQQRMGSTEQQTFRDPKPTNTFRIFLVGESAVQGYPQPRQLASSAFLQLILQDLWPERQVEVINLGTTAVASFPVLGILNEALAFQPDLVVIYTGNNEFFGTYGVASTGRAGSKPWMLKVNRFFYSLATVQALAQFLSSEQPDLDRTLMESMMAQTFVAAKDWRRNAAANNLYHNIAAMLENCRSRKVPALVCTLPANERDLAPIGAEKLDALPAKTQDEVISLLSDAEKTGWQNDPEATAATLRQVITLHPDHARAHYLLGQTQLAQGQQQAALGEFVKAQDLDSMPWRPPSLSQEAILRAAREHEAPVCDLLAAFRAASAGGVIGWELMDDHVHPTLRGQALIAECIVHSLTNLTGPPGISATAVAQLPPWTNYAHRLGENIYDRFRVAHGMRKLFSAPFMRANNPGAFRRSDALATEIENQLSAEVRAVMKEWDATRRFAGSRCPITAAVAQLKLKQNQYKEALELFTIARREVPDYTSWQLEYSYFLLFCRQKLNGSLDAADRQLAAQAIQQGHFLAHHLTAENDFIERYTGFLHILIGELAEAVPFLELSRKKCSGIDRLAVDQALMVSYLTIGQPDKAKEILSAGAAAGGEFGPRYHSLLQRLPALAAARASVSTNIPATSHQ